MTPSPLVSVIVLNYNGLRHLETVLKSLERQTFPRQQYEIILADNGSSDRSIEFTLQRFPQVQVHNLGRNHGFAAGNNIAARQARGNILAFLNNDTEADPRWLEELVQAYHINPRAMYGSQAYNFSKRDISANSVTKLTAWGIPTNVNSYRQRAEILNGVFPSMYADAAGMLLSKKLFFELGGFDQSYFAYEEEKDLGWKGWLLGHPSYVVSSSVYYHRGGATLGEHSFRAVYLLWRNGLRNLVKYPSGRWFMSMAPLHVLFSLGVYFLIFLPMRRYGLIGAILGAYLTTLLRLPWLIGQRVRYQRRRTLTDTELRRLGLYLDLSESLGLSREFMRRRAALSAVSVNLDSLGK